MRKLIVTTTINHPTPAIRKFDSLPEWDLLVIADRKTPANYRLERGDVMFPGDYVDEYYDLIKLIGYDSVRLGRMIAFIEAHKRHADIVASIDDDCMPDDNWGKDIRLGESIPVTICESDDELCLDPLYCVNLNDYIWSRGFPIELLGSRVSKNERVSLITPLVRVDFCRGQGDIDASCRINPHHSILYYSESFFPFSPKHFSPINTQNTFIHGSVLKDFYANIPFIGRADDIWAGYIFQSLHPNSTVYYPPSTKHVQDRSAQSIVNDLEDEIFMYRNTYTFLKDLGWAVNCTNKSESIEMAIKTHLPVKALQAIELYRSYFQ